MTEPRFDARNDKLEEIRCLVEREPVVLFMKGTRERPACGFSAKVVDVLDELLVTYETRDVLADPALREAIKLYGDWPTLPQLYVGGKLVGGADIVVEMHRAGELLPLLRRHVPDAGALDEPRPEIAVTDAAIAAFRAFAGNDRPEVRLTIDREHRATLDLEAPHAGDVVLDLGEFVLSLDRGSASRAHGITIDFVESARGFRIDDPNAPPRVRPLAVDEYAAMRASGKPHLLLDVRTPEERALAAIEGSVLLDEEMMERLEEIDRTTPIVCQCHHGIRSRHAAERLVRMGFREVYNLTGGIDAWSVSIDPSVPRY